MNFSSALYAAQRDGVKIARSGWNGKKMWVCVSHPSTDEKVLKAEDFWNQHVARFAQENGGTATVLPYMIMKTADDKILLGWLASQSDMLSEDWEILDYKCTTNL